MLKKLSALLGALMLTASIGAVSIQAEDLINEDFEDCKPGVFTAANQKGTGCEKCSLLMSPFSQAAIP